MAATVSKPLAELPSNAEELERCLSDPEWRLFSGCLYKISDKNTALEKLFKHLGLYELDNQQRVDPLVAVLDRINAAGNVGFMPVAHDPEHDEG